MTAKKIEDIYLNEEVFHTFEIYGITFKVREIDGDTLTKITEKCILNPGAPRPSVDREKYRVELWKAAIVEPQIDFSKKVKASYWFSITRKIEEVLGISPEALGFLPNE